MKKIEKIIEFVAVCIGMSAAGVFGYLGGVRHARNDAAFLLGYLEGENHE